METRIVVRVKVMIYVLVVAGVTAVIKEGVSDENLGAPERET